MYGGKFAFVALEPSVLLLTVMPVVLELVENELVFVSESFEIFVLRV